MLPMLQFKRLYRININFNIYIWCFFEKNSCFSEISPKIKYIGRNTNRHLVFPMIFPKILNTYFSKKATKKCGKMLWLETWSLLMETAHTHILWKSILVAKFKRNIENMIQINQTYRTAMHWIGENLKGHLFFIAVQTVFIDNPEI